MDDVWISGRLAEVRHGPSRCVVVDDAVDPVGGAPRVGRGEQASELLLGGGVSARRAAADDARGRRRGGAPRVGRRPRGGGRLPGLARAARESRARSRHVCVAT